jgi:hypothetical protein
VDIPMNINKEDELKSIKKKIVKTQLIGTPGALLLGFGLYGMFGANGDAFHPLLNDESFVINILVVGAAIEIWQLYILIPLFKRQAKLVKNYNT